MGYIKVAIDLLKNPPKCQKCGKPMKPYALGGFFEALDQVIDIICCGNVKFICLDKEKNKQWSKYQSDKKKYDAEMKEYEKKCQNKLVQIGLKKAPKPPKPLPQAQEKVPCENHYKLKVNGGIYNEKVGKKKKGPVFDSEGRKIPGLFG